jgi:hypothetical protein
VALDSCCQELRIIEVRPLHLGAVGGPSRFLPNGEGPPRASAPRESGLPGGGAPTRSKSLLTAPRLPMTRSLRSVVGDRFGPAASTEPLEDFHRAGAFVASLGDPRRVRDRQLGVFGGCKHDRTAVKARLCRGTAAGWRNGRVDLIQGRRRRRALSLHRVRVTLNSDRRGVSHDALREPLIVQEELGDEAVIGFLASRGGPAGRNMSVTRGKTPPFAITACTCALRPLRSCTNFAPEKHLGFAVLPPGARSASSPVASGTRPQLVAMVGRVLEPH